MSPYYEDAAQLLRFMVARGWPLPHNIPPGYLVKPTATLIKVFCSCSTSTHAEAAEEVLFILEGIIGRREEDKARSKTLALIGTKIGPLMDSEKRRRQSQSQK